MKRAKVIFGIMTATLISISLIGCSGDISTTTSSTETQITETAPQTLGITKILLRLIYQAMQQEQHRTFL